MDNSQAYGDQLDSLLEISAEIASLHQLAAVEDRALAYCLELTDSEFGFIGLPDARGDSMIVHAIKGFAPPPGFRDRYGFMSIRPSVFGITLLDGEPRISNDVVHDPLSVGQPPGHPPVKCFIGIPLKVGGTLIGMMGAANRPGGYGSDEERLLSTFANQVAIAIDNARLYDQQREMITRLVSVVDLATSGAPERPTVRPRFQPWDRRADDTAPAEAADTDARRESNGGRPSPLTPAQQEILSLIVDGCSNREIAARVHLSENTVKSHTQQLFRKMGVRNRVEAAIKATREGWL